MTVLSRGARNRRGGRRPGWLLLTVLLVLAIAASSALVFTNRAELLKLAVILSLWAAVIAAFVSVIYRRQSDLDAARARDLKLVYDLQLDREISARREYELSVESHLRRELASELRAQAADEVAALRSELAALRANLEILFDADLGDRPALEGDRGGDWTRDTTTMPPVPGRVESSRITPVRPEDTGSRPVTAESPIIDVPEEPLVPPSPYAPPPPSPRRRRRAEPAPEPEPTLGGSHRRPSENGEQPDQRPSAPPPPEPPGPEPQSDVAAAAAALAAEKPPAREAPEWRPVNADGRWLPPGAPDSNWVANSASGIVVPSAAAGTPAAEPRGRHWTPPEEAAPAAGPQSEPVGPRARHSVGGSSYGQPDTEVPQPPARHRGAPEEEPPRRRARDGEQIGGPSVADLLARLQANGTQDGGGRRRRED
ncbi:DUF6779 domain-containing protein [Mycolicibacterium helvum]|uniref:DUF6779 domain-containing protein n=1 Tax=Mycolicibacterium helvum TaxID=1534349 RepID=A0A7I7T651_9MYCO|nr:DUF6779 domain-containing protein [Mycolicibacterium helvum]BBY64480.1 hypothetical protein MHEL_27230 [Mycolicibacterium helvum]